MVLVAVLVSLAACASGGGGGAGGMATLEMLRLAGSREADPPRDGSESFVVDTVAAPAAAVFNAVRSAYETLEIPFTFYEADQLRLGGFVQQLGDLEGGRPSSWVDCGRGITAEPYADVYQVSMAVATRVVALDPTTSTVETVIRARARARDVSAELLRCSSFGAFEGRIAELVGSRVAR
jgi:hypothetical protein